MKSIKQIAILVSIFTIVVGVLSIQKYLRSGSSVLSQNQSSHANTFVLSGNIFNVEIVKTPSALSRGLSGRESLGENEGMLFVFGNEGKYGFWMNKMNFPIDIFWFSSDKTLISVSENIEPSTYPDVFHPLSDVLYVLEVKAGAFSKFNFSIGDVFSLE